VTTGAAVNFFNVTDSQFVKGGFVVSWLTSELWAKVLSRSTYVE